MIDSITNIENQEKNKEQEDYFFTASIIIDECIDRVWSFIINPNYFKLILPKDFTNYKLSQKTSSFCPGDEFTFYWIAVSNIHSKIISIMDYPMVKKLTLDISLNIGIYYRKTFNLFKISNNNTTLLKIILSKMPNKKYDHENFISFTKLNPNLYVSHFLNINKLVKLSYDNLFNSESIIVNKNMNDSWNIITDFQKISDFNPKLGQNFIFKGDKYKQGSFVKCFHPETKKYIFMTVKLVEKKINKNLWIYALETFGADIKYKKQEIQIRINRINDNKTQISLINIFKQVLTREYIENFRKKKNEIMKKIKEYINIF